jgi:hypothetical protein
VAAATKEKSKGKKKKKLKKTILKKKLKKLESTSSRKNKMPHGAHRRRCGMQHWNQLKR